MLACAGSSGVATAQRYAPIGKPQSGWDLGYELETRFSEYAGTCGLGKPLKMTKNGIVNKDPKTISSIDADVIGKLHLDTGYPIQSPKLAWLGNTFGYIYAENEWADPQWDPQRLLSFNYQDDKTMSPFFGFPATQLTASCGSILKSSLNADAGMSFPVATLKAGLDAEYDRRTRTVLRLAKGNFTSPVWAMWQPGGDTSGRSKARFFVSMLLWNWYHRVQPAGKSKILTSFRGTAFFSETTNNVDGSAGGSLDGHVNLPFLSGGANVEARVDGNRELTIQDYAVFVDPDRPEVRGAILVDLPTLDEVLKAAASTANPSKIAISGDNPIASNQSRTFSVEIDALPKAYCEGAAWQVRDAANAAAASSTMTVETAERKPGTTVCNIVLRYTAGTVQAGKDITLTPYLTSNEEYSGKRIMLPLGRLVLQTTDLPKLTPLPNSQRARVDKVAGSDPVRYTLVWTVDFKLQDNGQFTDKNRIRTGDLGLDCPDGTLTLGDATFESSFAGSSTGSTRTLRLTGTAEFQGGDLIPNYEYSQCHISGMINFLPLDGSQLLERRIPEEVTLFYPKRVKP